MGDFEEDCTRSGTRLCFALSDDVEALRESDKQNDRDPNGESRRHYVIQRTPN
jgi:hypothetical protein